MAPEEKMIYTMYLPTPKSKWMTILSACMYVCVCQVPQLYQPLAKGFSYMIYNCHFIIWFQSPLMTLVALCLAIYRNPVTHNYIF